LKELYDNLQLLNNYLTNELNDAHEVIEELEVDSDDINELQKSYDELEIELNDAYQVIDGLEMQLEILGEK